MLAALAKPLGGIHSLAVDVSDMRAVIRLEGEGVREVLMKGSRSICSATTTRRARCAACAFAEIAALLHVVEDDVFDIYVFRSYADYAWDFLLATAREPAKVRLFGAQDAPT